MRISKFLGSLLALSAGCATSNASSGTAPAKSQAASTAQQTATTKDDKLICQTERPVGSNIPKRVCRTQAQIDKDREDAQKSLVDSNHPGPKNN